MVDFSPVQGRQVASFIASVNWADKSEIMVVLQNGSNCGDALHVPFSLLLRSLFKVLLVVKYNSISCDFSKMFYFIQLTHIQQNIQKCHIKDLFYS